MQLNFKVKYILLHKLYIFNTKTHQNGVYSIVEIMLFVNINRFDHF